MNGCIIKLDRHLGLLVKKSSAHTYTWEAQTICIISVFQENKVVQTVFDYFIF